MEYLQDLTKNLLDFLCELKFYIFDTCLFFKDSSYPFMVSNSLFSHLYRLGLLAMALPVALAIICNIPTPIGLRGTNLHIICDVIHLQIAQVRLLLFLPQLA